MAEFIKPSGTYIRPDYTSDPDDDDDDDFDDDITDDEDEGETENFIENQEKSKEEKKTMQTTPFGTPAGGSGFGTGSTWGYSGAGNTGGTTGSPWSTPAQPTFGSTWQRPGTGSTWGNTGTGSVWGNSGSTWASGNNSNRKELDRNKRFIFCDVLDCLVETLQSAGKPGLLPRGIFDIRLKFEVWDKLACFNPIKIYAMVPKTLILSSNESQSWRTLLEYIICSISEYLRVPYSTCQILVQSSVDQPKSDLIRSIIDHPGFDIPKDQILQIGINSGLYGQSNRDLIVAEQCGIDYLDLGQLMSQYF